MSSLLLTPFEVSKTSEACELVQTLFFTGAYTASDKHPVKIAVWPCETSVSSLSTSEESTILSSDDDSVSQKSVTESGGRPKVKLSRPPGFKEVRSRVKCFTSKKGQDDFQWWVEDYEEASRDYHWSDQDRARWFSWFVSGPAKLTWQRTLKESDKASW